MVIDFSTIDLKQRPQLILRNLDGTAISGLGCAYGIKAELYYNEVSSITFELPRFVDGIATEAYDKVVGTRIVELEGWGQFYLVDPSTKNDGVKEIKCCKAYSLEYEFTKKKISLNEGTYNFWNPATPNETVLGIILEYMPSWSVGSVDPALIGKYRTFSISNSNIYDFMKSTLQKSYNCIFDFDTYNRRVNVKHVETDAEQAAVYLTMDNLIKELDITEDSEHILTVLDVNGADGVNIRNVNPLGTNKIYNLDYYMNTEHFSQAMIDKWNNWKTAFATNQPLFYTKSIERMLKIQEIELAKAQLDEKKNTELASLKNIQAARIEKFLADGALDLYVGLFEFSSTDIDQLEPSGYGYERQKYVDIGYANENHGSVWNVEPITFPTATGTWFDYHYIGDDPSEFYRPDIYIGIYVGSSGERIAHAFYSQEPVTAGDVCTIPVHNASLILHLVDTGNPDLDTKIVNSVKSTIDLQEIADQIAALEAELVQEEADIEALIAERDALTAELVAIRDQCAFSNFFTAEELLILDRYFIEDSIEESSFVISTVDSYATDGTYSKIESEDQIRIYFRDGTNTLTDLGDFRYLTDIRGGTIHCLSEADDSPNWNDRVLSAEVINAVVEERPDEGVTLVVVTCYLGSGTFGDHHFDSASFTAHGHVISGATLDWELSDGAVFFTANTSAYNQYSVEWELYEYGAEMLSKLAYPSYTFNIGAANFFALEDYISFVQTIGLGKRIYLDDDHGQILKPILVGVSLDLDNLASLSLQFGSTYNLSDSAFSLVDLLEKSVSMGKTVDTSRYNYNAFIDSGASTSVKEFMDSSLDVAKNAILSSSGQAISWDSSGIHCRKLRTGGGYEPEEIAIINNNIVFTTDSWQTTQLAIGKFSDPNFGDVWGIAAPHIVGTLVAGNNLVIESTKQDGTNSAFRVDGDGAVLYNAHFELTSRDVTALGVNGRHILLDPNVGLVMGVYPVLDQNGDVDENNARFWADMEGNLHLRGTLDGCNGTFNGAISWIDQGENQHSGSISFTSGSSGQGSATRIMEITTDASIAIVAESSDANYGNIRISASNTIWIRDTASQIYIFNDGGSSAGSISLKNYIKGIVNGTIT